MVLNNTCSLDCEQSLFSQSSLSSAGLERANWPRGKLESFPSAFARFARFPRSRFLRSRDHPKGLLAVYMLLEQHMSMCGAHIDLTKAFDQVCRKRSFMIKILSKKIRFSPNFITLENPCTPHEGDSEVQPKYICPLSAAVTN